MNKHEKTTLHSIIIYLSNTRDDERMTGYCANKEQTKGCLMRHIMRYGEKMGFNKIYQNRFEIKIANEYMFFSVNDGENPKYQQETPKERCIEYLKNILNGKEKTIVELIDETFY